MTALNMTKLRIEKIPLPKYKLTDIVDVLQNGLQKNYADVNVDIAQCPDFRQAPYNLLTKGLGGKTALIQVGDPEYVIPNTRLDKIYDFNDVASVINVTDGFIFGAGAGPWPSVGYMSEMIANVEFKNGSAKCYTRNVVSDKDTKTVSITHSPEDESRFSLLGNLFYTEGKSEEVIRIRCKHRIGPNGFPTSIRDALAFGYGEKPVGLGMIFRMTSGAAKHHVAPDFAKDVPKDKILEWLNLVTIKAPLVSVGTIISTNPEGFFLQKQHFHSFNDEGRGGHYHNDENPENAEYCGYVSLADTIWSIDTVHNAEQLFSH